MPATKRTYPPTPSKGTRKTRFKRARKVTTMAIPRSLRFPVPSKMRSVLRYSEQVNIAIPSAASTSYTYAANSLFDPNVTGAGHQPAGFDQLMLLYNRFCVEKSIITVSFSQESNSNFNALVGVTTSSDIISTTDFRRYTENPFCSYDMIKAPQSIVTVKQVFNGLDFFNKGYQADTDKQGTDSANPAELIFFNLFGQPANPGNTAGSTQLQVQIEYHALFSDPKALQGS